ncbi:MAG: hypothetical protein Q9175_004886 [Cornicularia normoerica]
MNKMNREEVLSQLRRKKIRVQAEEGEECMICKEEYSTRKGAEKKIALPCEAKHTVGSKCIQSWLQEHNTCPVCRHEFFSEICAGIVDDDDDDEDEDEDDEYDEDDLMWDEMQWEGDDDSIFEEEKREEELKESAEHLQSLCLSICGGLGFEAFDNLIRNVSYLLASSVWCSDIVQDANALDNFSLAAACVYIAGHLADQRIKLRRLARVFPLTERSISDAYCVIYDEGDYLIDEEMVTLLGTDERKLWDRLPEPLEPRETRLQARLRREREMNDW